MLNGLFSNFSGKFVNSRRLEIISNNIANVSTPGLRFQDLFLMLLPAKMKVAMECCKIRL